MLTWLAFTKLADTVVMLPAAMLCLFWLAIAREWRLAGLWCLLLGAGLLLVTATKIAFIGWGIGIPELDFTGISGHAMRAAAIMPVTLYLLAQKARPWGCRIAVIAGMGFGLGVSVSRLMLQVHSASEVMAGYILGAAISLTFIRMLVDASRIRLPKPALALGLLLLLPASMAAPAPTEQWLQQVALSLSGHGRPFVRVEWKEGSVDHPSSG
jgi:membrane-associated phospholipid phosphatase